MSTKIRINRKKLATVSGVNYRDLRFIMTMAENYAHDRIKEFKGEGTEEYDVAVRLLKELRASLDKGIREFRP